MRIALAHPYVWPEVRRGAERYVDDLAWYLRGAGHEVELVTGTTGENGVEIRPDGVVVRRRHHVGLVKLARLGVDPGQAFVLAATPVLREQRYDVVHAMVPAASVAARLAGTPSVFTFIGHPTRAQFADRRADLVLHRVAVKVAAAVTVLSTGSARTTRELFGVDADVLAPGVRLDRFPPRLDPRTGSANILFSAAPGDRRKGLDRLLAAFGHVLDELPDARLRVSGQGDADWALDTLGAGRDRVAAAIDLLGAGEPTEIPARYAAATLTVLPAVDEAFGLALVESLASGTPVVSSADGGMVDIVDDPAIGHTVPVGDGAALARAIVETVALAAAPGTPSACATHARRWGWAESIGPAHEQLYERVRRPR